MTEADWLAATDRSALVDHIAGDAAVKADPVRKGARDRKFQLLGVACVWRVARHLTDRGRAGLAVAERLADERVDPAERAAALENLGDGTLRRRRTAKTLDSFYSADPRVEHATAGLVHLVVDVKHIEIEALVRQYMAAEQALRVAELEGTVRDERAAQAALTREIFGNPFRPVALNPSWLSPTALSLARRVYESRDFSPLPILADALQDAGCDHPDVLAHCRSPGPHVRGCWVVDLVLGLSARGVAPV